MVDPYVFSCSYESRSIVIAESIEWALNSFAPHESPYRISPVQLLKGHAFIEHVLKTLVVRTFAIGYIPRSWHDITVKLIPKGNHVLYDESWINQSDLFYSAMS